MKIVYDTHTIFDGHFKHTIIYRRMFLDCSNLELLRIFKTSIVFRTIRNRCVRIVNISTTYILSGNTTKHENSLNPYYSKSCLVNACNDLKPSTTGEKSTF